MNVVSRKPKVDLNDYPYQRDVANRELLAVISSAELSILEEIVNGSIKITLEQLAFQLELDVKEIAPFLRRLEKVGLIEVKGKEIIVNKEQRKYISCELVKFQPSFEPDLHYLQCSLARVPIHLLPHWYAVPRAADSIFHSIVEKHFQTPRIYKRYLEELATEQPLMHRLVMALQDAPSYCLLASDAMELIGLSRDAFHSFSLAFEYNLAGCLCYRRMGDGWVEYFTLYHEWKEYQHFFRSRAPLPIIDSDAICRIHASDFGFVDDLTNLVQLGINGQPILLDREEKIAQHIPEESRLFYFRDLCRAACQLQLVRSCGDELEINQKESQNWLKKSKQDRASAIYSLMLSYTRYGVEAAYGCSERDFREVEKALKRVSYLGWIDLEAFIEGAAAAVNAHSQIALIQKGKKWRYLFPQYSSEDKSLITSAVIHHFFYSGLVAIGHYDSRLCFSVTPYGRVTFGE